MKKNDLQLSEIYIYYMMEHSKTSNVKTKMLMEENEVIFNLMAATYSKRLGQQCNKPLLDSGWKWLK